MTEGSATAYQHHIFSHFSERFIDNVKNMPDTAHGLYLARRARVELQFSS
jgi:hypothetical protein